MYSNVQYADNCAQFQLTWCIKNENEQTNREKKTKQVVVSANAASAGLLAEADAVLDRHLVPVKGYGLAGVVNDTSMVIDESGYARGIHYIDHSEEFQAA